MILSQPPLHHPRVTSLSIVSLELYLEVLVEIYYASKIGVGDSPFPPSYIPQRITTVGHIQPNRWVLWSIKQLQGIKIV